MSHPSETGMIPFSSAGTKGLKTELILIDLIYSLQLWYG